MFFPMGCSPPMYQHGISFPRLYLAIGVTTIRTTAACSYTDLEIKTDA